MRSELLALAVVLVSATHVVAQDENVNADPLGVQPDYSHSTIDHLHTNMAVIVARVSQVAIDTPMGPEARRAKYIIDQISPVVDQLSKLVFGYGIIESIRCDGDKEMAWARYQSTAKLVATVAQMRIRFLQRVEGSIETDELKDVVSDFYAITDDLATLLPDPRELQWDQ